MAKKSTGKTTKKTAKKSVKTNLQKPRIPTSDDKYGVPVEEFIVAWQASETLDQVSEITGMPKPICSARASKYRSDGIKLKRMPRHPSHELDVEALNHLIEQINEQFDIKGVATQGPRKKEPLTKKQVQDIVRETVEKYSSE